MDKFMKYLSWSLILVGLVIGPFYMIYGWYFSGSTVAYTENANQQTKEVKLEPSMNPIMLELQGYLPPSSRYFESSGVGTKTNEYTVYLQGSEEQLQKNLYLHFDTSKNQGDTGWKARVKEWILVQLGLSNKGWQYGTNVLRVPQKDQFTVDVKYNTSKHPVSYEKLNLEIRSNVIVPDPVIYLSGFGLIILALVMANMYFGNEGSDAETGGEDEEEKDDERAEE